MSAPDPQDQLNHISDRVDAIYNTNVAVTVLLGLFIITQFIWQGAVWHGRSGPRVRGSHSAASPPPPASVRPPIRRYHSSPPIASPLSTALSPAR